MIRSILLALDESASSGCALELAVEECRRHGARLTGMGVLDVPGITAPAATPLGGDSFKAPRDEALLANASRRIRGFLSDFGSRCAAEGIAHDVVESRGVPSEQIEMESHRHDLVIVGRDANFHFETLPEDSDTIRHLAAHTPRPLIVAPCYESRGDAVVVAYDGSLQAAQALHLFVLLGLHRSRPIHVVSVYPAKDQAEAACSGAARLLRSHGVLADVRALESREDPAEVLLGELDVLRADRLVMGAYGLSGFKALFGSFTQTMLRRCPLPVFVYH